jgi:hypothetical protein
MSGEGKVGVGETDGGGVGRCCVLVELGEHYHTTTLKVRADSKTDAFQVFRSRTTDIAMSNVEFLHSIIRAALPHMII